MKRWERLAALTLTLVGLGAAIMAYRMGLGTVAFPGSGFFPFWLALLLSVASYAYFLSQLGPDDRPVKLREKGVWVEPALGTVVLLVYVFRLLVQRLDFLLPTCLFFLLLVVWESRSQPGSRDKKVLAAAVILIGAFFPFRILSSVTGSFSGIWLAMKHQFAGALNWVGFILATSLFLLIWLLMERGKKAWVRPALAVGIMLIFAFLLGWLGFFPSTFLLFVIWLVMERERPLTIGLVATLGTACVYLLFTLLLRVPLPAGRFFR